MNWRACSVLALASCTPYGEPAMVAGANLEVARAAPPANEHDQLRRHLRDLLIQSGLVHLGDLEGTAWILPGGKPDLVVSEISIQSVISKFARHPAEYPEGIWVMTLPFTEPCKLELTAQVRASIGTQEVRYKSAGYRRHHSIVFASQPYREFRAVPVTAPGFVIEQVDLEVQGADRAKHVITWP